MATHVRQPQPHREEDPPVQLFLPRPGKEEAILALLRLKNPTKQDVLDHLSGRYDKTETHHLTEQEELYYNRRKQIHEWSSQVETGGAKIDEHDRLVLATEPDPLPPMNHEPEPPRNPEAEEEEERRLRQQEEQDAEIAISRAVKRYRKQGVAEEDFQLIRIAPENQDSSVNLTFRRICCAVLAVVTAFICIMLQTLPLLSSVTPSNAIFDKLMVELLNVRHFREHAVHCPQLNRDDSPNWLLGDVSAINCAHGVLHIPSRPVLREEYRTASEPRQSDALEDYITGVNVSWFIKCHPVPTNEMPSRNPASGVCPTTSSERCFRGIHDDWLSDFDIESALEMGAALIKGGGDHFDIHENIVLLDDNVPLLLEKVKYLLRREYGLHQTIVPVAFRVNIALPMDATDVLGTKTSKLLGKNVNKTNYVNWLKATKRHNEDALFSIGPFGRKPIRDTCNLMADTEADPRFAIHTSIFLSEGAGKDFAGGVSLYVDDHRSNSNPRQKIQRGISIDGHRGRIVVSTGGLENRRCRLPTRAGIRAVLQIWWDFETTTTCSAAMY